MRHAWGVCQEIIFLSIIFFLYCYWWCSIVGIQANNNKFHSIINIYWKIIVATNSIERNEIANVDIKKFSFQTKEDKLKMKILLFFTKFSRRNLENKSKKSGKWSSLNYQEVLFSWFLVTLNVWSKKVVATEVALYPAQMGLLFK